MVTDLFQGEQILPPIVVGRNTGGGVCTSASGVLEYIHQRSLYTYFRFVGQSIRKGIPKGVNSGHLISKQLYIMHQITSCVGNYPLQKRMLHVGNYSFSGVAIPKRNESVKIHLCCAHAQRQY